MARLVQKAHWIALGAAFVYLIAAQAWQSPLYGWWHDEVYSLWASDPASPLQRLVFDSNPPLYFLALRLVRSVIPDERAAMLVVSAIALGCVAVFLLSTASTSIARRRAALALALFTVSGVTTFFFQEARAFFPAACTGLAVSWTAVLLVDRTPPRHVEIILALLAATSALLHFYGALLTGCLAAGLLALALLGRRRDLARPALVLGVTSVAVFGAWFVFAADRVERIGWIVFSVEDVRGALWMVRSFVLGPAWALILIAPLAVFAALRARLQPSLIVFAVATASFFALPVLISFKIPIIVGRYWCVGVALFTMPMALLFDELAASAARFRLAVAGLAALVVVVGAANGLQVTRHFLVDEPVWANAPRVHELGRGCGAGTIAVPDYTRLYATASDLPESTFVVSTPGAPANLRGGCPIVAWAESLEPGQETEQTLLARLGLDATTDRLRIVRTPSGFIAVRAGDAS